MTSGTRLLGFGDMAAPAGESNCQTSTFGMIHIASVFPPGHVNGFRSKMNVSSERSGLRIGVFLFSWACAASTPAPNIPKVLPKNSRRFGCFELIVASYAGHDFCHSGPIVIGKSTLDTSGRTSPAVPHLRECPVERASSLHWQRPLRPGGW